MDVGEEIVSKLQNMGLAEVLVVVVVHGGLSSNNIYPTIDVTLYVKTCTHTQQGLYPVTPASPGTEP